jgi:hypothetical protein
MTRFLVDHRHDEVVERAIAIAIDSARAGRGGRL